MGPSTSSSAACIFICFSPTHFTDVFKTNMRFHFTHKYFTPHTFHSKMHSSRAEKNTL